MLRIGNIRAEKETKFIKINIEISVVCEVLPPGIEAWQDKCS